MTLPKAAAAALAALLCIPILIGAVVSAAISALLGQHDSHAGVTVPSSAALHDIPTDYLALYRQAAAVCPGLDWSILAAIGHIETDHGRSRAPGVASGENSAGAGGPMQFLQPTFDAVTGRHRIPPGGADPPSRYNAHDAIYAAAYNLCDNGAAHGRLHDAIYAYNHADWYVQEVLDQAARYTTPACTPDQPLNPAAGAAIAYACHQLGQPYLWGGNGPADGGFDCSGLTKAAYAAAGITLPRTADTQYHAGPLVPAGQPLRPGDLVFYGAADDIHHVALYLGTGRVVTAPDRGQSVTVSAYRWPGDDYLGATRPAK